MQKKSSNERFLSVNNNQARKNTRFKKYVSAKFVT